VCRIWFWNWLAWYGHCMSIGEVFAVAEGGGIVGERRGGRRPGIKAAPVRMGWRSYSRYAAINASGPSPVWPAMKAS